MQALTNLTENAELQQLEQDTGPALPQRSFVTCQIENKDPLDSFLEQMLKEEQERTGQFLFSHLLVSQDRARQHQNQASTRHMKE